MKNHSLTALERLCASNGKMFYRPNTIGSAVRTLGIADEAPSSRDVEKALSDSRKVEMIEIYDGNGRVSLKAYRIKSK